MTAVQMYRLAIASLCVLLASAECEMRLNTLNLLDLTGLKPKKLLLVSLEDSRFQDVNQIV